MSSRITVLTLIFLLSNVSSNPAQYLWLDNFDNTQSISQRINTPDGFKRVDIPEGTFANWLRNLPLKKGNPPIYYYDGDKKQNQHDRQSKCQTPAYTESAFCSCWLMCRQLIFDFIPEIVILNFYVLIVI